MKGLGLTVYGCERDEADIFNELSPRFGVVPTITSDAVSEAGVSSALGNRCVSVGHKCEISGRELRALREAGVAYLWTRSIGFDHIDLNAAEMLGIAVDNVVYAPDGVADYTLMLILMVILGPTTRSCSPADGTAPTSRASPSRRSPSTASREAPACLRRGRQSSNGCAGLRSGGAVRRR